jgi:hypothetical protein
MSEWDVDGENNGSSTALGFNVEDVEAPSFDLLPPGRYQVACSSAKVQPSKNNPSTVLANVEETIVDGAHAGRKIWSRYVIAHADGKVMARGRADVVRLMSAYGVGGGDLAPCVGRECVAAVDVEPAKGDWEASNKIKKREAIAGAPMPKPAARPAGAAAAPKPAAKPAPAFLSRRAVDSRGASSDGES